MLVATALAAGCGGASQGVGGHAQSSSPFAERSGVAAGFAQETWRRTPPAAGDATPFAPPRVEEARLSNGLRVLYAERRGLPIVAVSFTTLRGAAEGGPGIGSFAAAMLMQGTERRGALQISDDLERLGAHMNAGADYDYIEVRAQTLKPNLEGTLDLMAEVVTRPKFEPAEVERERSKRLTALAQQRDSAGAQLHIATAAALFPAGHPYATTLLGTRDAVQSATPATLRAFYEAVAAPDRAVLTIAGDLTKDEAIAALERAFGAWKGKPASPQAPVRTSMIQAGGAVDARGAERILLVDRPGAPQSNIALALVGLPRRTKDYEAVLVLNAILGGQFSSRMNMNLREDKGYSYGVRSAFDMRHDRGPFTAGGAVKSEPTDAAVRELLGEVTRIRATDVTDEELEDAKKDLIQQLPSRFETAAGTAVALSGLAIYGLPLDEYATRPARIASVTKADVRRVALEHLKPEALRVVVVGDAQVVRPGLEKLGLGAVALRPAQPEGPAEAASPAARTHVASPPSKAKRPPANAPKQADPKNAPATKAGPTTKTPTTPATPKR